MEFVPSPIPLPLAERECGVRSCILAGLGYNKHQCHNPCSVILSILCFRADIRLRAVFILKILATLPASHRRGAELQFIGRVS